MIHVGLRRDWLDIIVQTLSDTGLGHAQLTALAAVAMRRRVHWGWIVLLTLVVMGGSAAYETSKYGKPPTVAVAYLACLGLFWLVPGRVAGLALISAVWTGLARLLIVKPVSRQRPSNLGFAQPMEPIFGMTSFPSGHTTTTFAIAVFLAWALAKREEHWIGTTALAWAAMVGLSRIYVGVHYPTDVIGGAALGAIGGTITYLVASKYGFLGEEPKQIEEGSE